VNKKVGLLLLPLIPLSAIGIVEVANRLLSPSSAIVDHAAPDTAPAVSTQPVRPPVMPKG
jgi:hypothetical protein